jgi:hypothetical protein
LKLKWDNVEIEVTMEELKDPDVRKWVDNLMRIWQHH